MQRHVWTTETGPEGLHVGRLPVPYGRDSPAVMTCHEA